MRHLSLIAGVFLSAAASLCVEFAIVRLSAPYVGQSLLPWSAAIACVLLGLTIGHLLGGLLARACKADYAVRFCLCVIWCAAGTATLAMPFLVRAYVRTLEAEAGFGISAILVLAAFSFPPSLFAGFVSPLAVRLVSFSGPQNVPRAVAAIYAASAAGSVAGTMLAGFVFLERIGAGGLAAVTAAIWLVLGLLSLPLAHRGRFAQQTRAMGVACVFPFVWMAMPTGPCHYETRYTCIRLFDQSLPHGNVLRFLTLDEGVHSASDRFTPERLHLGYAALADKLAASVFSRTDDARALIIGGGGATLPRAWASREPSVHVTSIELDPVVAQVASEHMWAGQQASLTTLIGDGRSLVRTMSAQKQFSVVLMDAYRTRSVPPHLVTSEFNRLVADRMTSDGLFLSNVIDRAVTPLLALSIQKTLAEIFPAVDLWMADAGADGMTNYVLAAWKDARDALRPDSEVISASILQAGHEVRQAQVRWRRVDREMAIARWGEMCGSILLDDLAPVDRLLAGNHRGKCNISLVQN